jgi:hypothetical protein
MNKAVNELLMALSQMGQYEEREAVRSILRGEELKEYGSPLAVACLLEDVVHPIDQKDLIAILEERFLSYETYTQKKPRCGHYDPLEGTDELLDLVIKMQVLWPLMIWETSTKVTSSLAEVRGQLEKLLPPINGEVLSDLEGWEEVAIWTPITKKREFLWLLNRAEYVVRILATGARFDEWVPNMREPDENRVLTLLSTIMTVCSDPIFMGQVDVYLLYEELEEYPSELEEVYAWERENGIEAVD